MLKPTIALFTADAQLVSQGQELASRLSLPFTTSNPEEYDFVVLLTPQFLGLQKTSANAKPLYIDFLSGAMQYRRKQASLRNEILARALGLKNKMPKYIVDGTAGLARDSFILASLGFEVTLLERSPIINALIEDAINRAQKDPEVATIIKRLHLQQTDTLAWLNNTLKTNDKPEIIYLDPMFPQSKKSALSKQDMRFFHEIVGDDLDADQLLITALTCATQRVVVKRPRLAEPLAGRKPTLSMEGSSNRFDIYLTRTP